MMNRIFVGLGLAAAGVIFSNWAVADDDHPPAPPVASPASGKTVEELIEDLGADSADTRESATDELVSRGSLAVPALEKARESEDPEIAWRAKSALREIRGADARAAGKRLPGTGGGRSSGSSISIRIGGPGAISMSQDSEGKVSVTVTEEENGVSTTKTYSADSMEEFREKYPEVADKYDLGEDGGFRIDFGPGLGGRIDFGDEDPFAGIDERLKGHMEGWRKQFDEQMRDLDRLMEDLRQGRLPDPRLRRRFPIPPKAGEPDDEEEAPPEKSSGATPIFGATLSVLDPALRYQLDLPEEEGVLVESVVPGSPAEKAGLNQYDVILKVNGESVVSALGFRRQWKEAARSLPAEVTVVREGRREVFRVEAGPAEENR